MTFSFSISRSLFIYHFINIMCFLIFISTYHFFVLFHFFFPFLRSQYPALYTQNVIREIFALIILSILLQIRTMADCSILSVARMLLEEIASSGYRIE